MNRNISVEDYILPDNLNPDNKSYIYGEVDERDIYKVIKDLININSILDVGSGTGKLVSYLSHYYTYADGVEINEQRYNKSLTLMEQYNLNNVEFILDDYQHIYFGSYDLIYCCNKVFEKEDNNILYSKLLNEFTGYCILFDYNHMLKRFLIGTYKVRTSWNKNELIYLFML